MILDHEELAFSSERLLVSYVPDSSQWIPLLLENYRRTFQAVKESQIQWQMGKLVFGY